MSYNRGKLSWSPAPHTAPEQRKLTFDNRPVCAPAGVSVDWTDIAGRVSRRAFAGGRSVSWKPAPRNLDRGGRLITAATVRWTAVLTRIER